MADTKITALAALTGANAAPASDLVTVVDVSDTTMAASGTNKQMTLSELKIALGVPKVSRLGIAHTISSTTATVVSGLTIPLEVGTWAFQALLLVQSATITVSPMLGVNFTGTAAVRGIHFRFADATTAITAEVHQMDDEGVNTFGYISGRATRTFTTTAPNLGTTATNAVGVINTDTLVIIEGLLIVTVAGDLEIWHGSETATSTTVSVGSSMIATKTS